MQKDPEPKGLAKKMNAVNRIPQMRPVDSGAIDNPYRGKWKQLARPTTKQDTSQGRAALIRAATKKLERS